MKRLFSFQILLVLPVFFLTSCTPPTTVPIKTVDFMQPGGKRQETLLVFLPGIHSSAAVFAEEGFVAAVRESGIKADMIGVEAHLGYYEQKQFLPRLKADVIAPAKRQGYANIWLVGISLGGFGAIWYDIENPGDLTGIVVLAPYLGDPEVVEEVARAGGLIAWHPSLNGDIDDQHKIWQGLKTYELREKNEQRVYLGYGQNDKFVTADGMLAEVLPPDQVFTTDGGHDWITWNTMWNAILKSRAFARSSQENLLSPPL
jgi:pimeloyl-ACP methyl ester carboxylesterase